MRIRDEVYKAPTIVFNTYYVLLNINLLMHRERMSYLHTQDVADSELALLRQEYYGSFHLYRSLNW